MTRNFTLLAAAMTALCASADLPVTLVNNTNGQFSDDEIYIAILGQQGEDGRYIYYDMTRSSETASLKPLDESANTLAGTGPFTSYADIFTKLSDIPGKKVALGDTYACRMFISFRSPMYLHAFAQGYAGADLNNPGDPNASIRWELVEFTNSPRNDKKDYDEVWINTTRVDAFQYPMGLELWSTGNYPYTKRGEYVNYSTVVDKWNSALGNTVYKDCFYNLITKDDIGGIIKQPSKVESIKKQNLFDAYINKVWEYYSSNTANINMGVLGRWTGKVEGGKFVLTCAEGHYWEPGSVAEIDAKPTTEDVIEGAGVFARGTDISKTVQAMFCAAFNRGQIRTTTALQDWDPAVTAPFAGGTDYPCNEYVKFFHDPSVTVSGGKTYAFAYDDTFDQSATCYANNPTRVTVTIGGFANPISQPVEPTVSVVASPASCKVGESVEFTAGVDAGDYEVTGVVIKVDGRAIATSPVEGGAQSEYKARWTATSEGQHPVVAEITAGGTTYTSATLQYEVTASQITPGPVEDDIVLVKDFTADDHSEGSFAGPYKIKLYSSDGGVMVSATFEGEYSGFVGPWLWNFTNGFAENEMSPTGDGSYEYRIPDVARGTTVTVAVKIAFTGGMGVSPQISYTVPVTSGVGSIEEETDLFVIYPNPASSELHTRTTVDGMLSILSMSGACVARHEITPGSTVDVSGLRPGIYLVEFKENGSGSAAVTRMMIK